MRLRALAIAACAIALLSAVAPWAAAQPNGVDVDECRTEVSFLGIPITATGPEGSNCE
ncbi:hypothetical protein [Streptomyces halobius]|uniref:Small secreted domain DUF320 n=1 Tax=Streptomyces halobius TaxID=2879846 RepID=A0ABY4M3G5_9ACTN|nr:hypothetical protein [Streptomyces halobius]UQA91773.1 hypothetical protein K9S39_07795 [Streptomyces halobius]